MIRCLLSISFLLFFFGGFSKETRQPVAFMLKQNCFNWDSTMVYRANISFNEYQFSGIIVFNTVDFKTYRMIMTPEVGPTLIDLNLTCEKYTRNYVARKLNRKALLQMFWEDFGTLLGLFSIAKQVEKDYDNVTDCFGLAKKKLVCYSFCNEAVFPENAFFYFKDKLNTKFTYFYQPNMQPDSIKIEHLKFNLNYSLYKVK